MTDTPPEIAGMVRARRMAWAGAERFRMSVQRFDAARRRALASGGVALERSTAVHRDPAQAGRRFLPLLPGDCALPDALRRCKVVDFREESETAFAEVLATEENFGQMRRTLGRKLQCVQLYKSYLENFRINTQDALQA